jgi:uridine phosphorylase
MTPAIINPTAPKGGPPLPPLAVMAGSLPDLSVLCGTLGIEKTGFRSFITSRLYTPKDAPCCLVGPMIGAPYAVMLMETLIAWGARECLFVGWCGSVSPHVRIGDVIVPSGALIDEGTSLHYGMETGDRVLAGERLTAHIARRLTVDGISFHSGDIWTTDGFFRETPERVTRFQGLGALAVEMELSALFSVAGYRGVAAGAVLIVSDTLSDLTWRQGFVEKRFKRQRRAVCEALGRLCRSRTQ